MRDRSDGEFSQRELSSEERKIADETHFSVRCPMNEIEPEICDGWVESVDLDDPAYIDHRGRIHLPGYVPECDECGNPHDFVVNGVRVFFP